MKVTFIALGYGQGDLIRLGREIEITKTVQDQPVFGPATTHVVTDKTNVLQVGRGGLIELDVNSGTAAVLTSLVGSKVLAFQSPDDSEILEAMLAKAKKAKKAVESDEGGDSEDEKPAKKAKATGKAKKAADDEGSSGEGGAPVQPTVVSL